MHWRPQQPLSGSKTAHYGARGLASKVPRAGAYCSRKPEGSLRIAPLFETGDSRYVWLTRLQAVGVGERVGTTGKYDIYALK
jgi:hypothetical protein